MPSDADSNGIRPREELDIQGRSFRSTERVSCVWAGQAAKGSGTATGSRPRSKTGGGIASRLRLNGSGSLTSAGGSSALAGHSSGCAGSHSTTSVACASVLCILKERFALSTALSNLASVSSSRNISFGAGSTRPLAKDTGGCAESTASLPFAAPISILSNIVRELLAALGSCGL